MQASPRMNDHDEPKMEEISDTDWSTNTVRRRDHQAIEIENQALSNTNACGHNEVEEPRKFRIRKRHWQPDEETLGEVLQQELMAWRDMPLDQSTVRRTLRSPTGVINKKTTHTPSHDNEEVLDTAKYNNTKTSPQDECDSALHGLQPAIFAIKKSNFVEGSMNQTSRGTASIWTDALSIPSITSRSTSAFSEDESEPSTPRIAPSSRMSMSSSIDINEFKPLPPTPTTFKATMKRIGHKFRPSDVVPQQHKVDTTPKPSKASRKGLRKSFSTWKFFDSTASEADDEAVPDMPKTEHKTIRNTASSRTLRLLGRHKQQPDIDASVALLEERKRKAEIAYAEQFGTSRKRHKQDPETMTRSVNTENEHEPVTMRRRTSYFKMPDQKSIPAHRDSFIANTEKLPLPLDFSTSTSAIGQRTTHRRNSSRDSTSSRGSDRDRLKRVSRSELEKENQHLRELLRKRDKQTQLVTSEHEHHAIGTSRKSQTFGNQELSPAREHLRAALSSHPVNESSTLSNTENVITNSNGCKSFRVAEDLPPVPPLPLSMVSQDVLQPMTNKPGWSLDTATVKRKGPSATPGRTIELPRPLSMVLEGLEDDQGEGDDDLHFAAKKTSTLKYETSNIVKGSNLPGLKDCKENWNWPEDVF